MHAMSLKGGRQGRRRTAFAYPNSLGRTGSARYWYDSHAVSGARVFVPVLKRKADTSHFEHKLSQ